MGVRVVAAGVALGFGAMVAGAPAEAAFVADAGNTFPGNDCAGTLGTPPNCVYRDSPLIVKFDFDDDGNITETTLGSFASIDGSEFSFDFGNDGTADGTWTYTPDDFPDDPLVTGYTAKAGNGYNAFYWDGGAGNQFTGGWETPERKELSHIAFYDTVVPLPAALPLLGSGLLALWGIGRMRRRQQPVDPIAA